MATPTYVPLATTTVTSDSSVTFSSIPATYRDIIIVVRGNLSGAADVYLRFNGDSGNNYSFVQMAGPVGSSAATLSFAQISNTGAGEFSAIASVMDYSATDKHKTFLSRSNGDIVRAWACRWANTNAINQIEIATTSTWTTATLSLYGVN